jgi:hypothetical protein
MSNPPSDGDNERGECLSPTTLAFACMYPDLVLNGIRRRHRHPTMTTMSVAPFAAIGYRSCATRLLRAARNAAS